MTMPGRKGGISYRFGLNGMEKDDEIKGVGNSYTAQYWQYDSRIGRRWNLDPVIKTHLTPYQAFNNNPIIMVDPQGDDHYYSLQTGKFLYSDTKNSDEIRLISEKRFYQIQYQFKTVMYSDQSNFGLLSALETSSRATYASADNAAYKWSQKYNPYSMGFVKDGKVGREYMVSIYQFTLDRNGQKISVFALNKTKEGKEGHVDFSFSEKFYAGRISAVAHTHGGRGLSDSDEGRYFSGGTKEQFKQSGYYSLDGLVISDDITFVFRKKIPLYMSNAWGELKKLEYSPLESNNGSKRLSNFTETLLATDLTTMPGGWYNVAGPRDAFSLEETRKVGIELSNYTVPNNLFIKYSYGEVDSNAEPVRLGTR